jgi:hypothetical protein
MPVPSSSKSSSHVFCVWRMGDCRKTEPTNLALMILTASWFSPVPLKSLTCQWRGLSRILGWWSCMNRLRGQPCLYVAPVQNMVGKVPLVPLFLAGNSTPTTSIPYMFSKSKDAGSPFGCADAAALDGQRGSNIYKVNPWLWRFGRGQPRLGVCRSIRLLRGRVLSAMRGTSVQPRQNGFARRLQPD